jgi:hypothetical protein
MKITYLIDTDWVFRSARRCFLINYNKIKDDLRSKDLTPFIPWDQWERCKSSVQNTTSLDETVRDAQLVIEAAPTMHRITFATAVVDMR